MNAEKLKAVFALAKKSQAQVARELGKTPQSFSNKIQRDSLSQEELKQIAKICGAKYVEYIEFPDGTRI